MQKSIYSAPRALKAGLRAGALRHSSGFTLLEMLVVLMIVGILAAIAAPGWVAFLEAQRLDIARAQVAEAMQRTQSQAQLRRTLWEFRVREFNGVVQWSMHPADQSPTTAQWNLLDASIHLDDDETTLEQKDGVRRVQFNDRGHVNGRLCKLTLTSRSNPKLKRCVIITSLLGVIRTAQENPEAQEGKFCY